MFLGTEDVSMYYSEFLDVFTDKVDEILNKTITQIDSDYK